MSDAAARAIDTDAANYQLGNEVFQLANATFVRNRDTPDIYDANHVTNIRARTPQEIDELFAAADREFAHSGHRRFDVDFRTPPEFHARILLESGFERSDGLLLLLEGELLSSPPHMDIRPVESDADWEIYRELSLLDWIEGMKRMGLPPQEEVGYQMFQTNRRKQPPVQNWFAYDGERPVAYFNSWEGVDGVGQVENLFTHPDFRNRGFAAALIGHCVADSRAKGAGPVVIAADPTDTPKNAYARMGFRPIATATHYLKKLTK